MIKKLLHWLCKRGFWWRAKKAKPRTNVSGLRGKGRIHQLAQQSIAQGMGANDHLHLFLAYDHCTLIMKRHLHAYCHTLGWLTAIRDPNNSARLAKEPIDWNTTMRMRVCGPCGVFPHVRIFVFHGKFFVIEDHADLDALTKFAVRYNYYTERMSFHHDLVETLHYLTDIGIS